MPQVHDGRLSGQGVYSWVDGTTFKGAHSWAAIRATLK